MTDRELTNLAVATARAGIAVGQSPFGAVIARGGEPVAAAHNTVWADGDPTAHAEVNVIREATERLGTIDLSGCVIYTTCEPRPMCLAAIHWARLDRCVYGASIADAAEAGFHELHLRAADLAREGGSELIVEQLDEAEACVALFAEWRRAGRSRSY